MKQPPRDKSSLDLTPVEGFITDIGGEKENVIPILQAIQNHYDYLPQAALRRVCELTAISPASISGVSTFYSQFRHKPAGQHTVHVCAGTACHVKGAQRVIDAIRRHLKIGAGRDTDDDKLFTVLEVACLGCCTLAPVVQIGSAVYGHIHPENAADMLIGFLEKGERDQSREPTENLTKKRESLGEIRIGLGSCCIAGGSDQVYRNAIESVVKSKLPATVKRVGCVGICHQTPMIEIVRPDRPTAIYAKVKPGDVDDILLRYFRPRSLVKRMIHAVDKSTRFFESMFVDNPERETQSCYPLGVRDQRMTAFSDQQIHIATERYGEIDPVDLEEYRSARGFVALRRCVTELTPDRVIDEIEASGLRGRGGGGFPTGKKWRAVSQEIGKRKFLICNGDEGDPGAFMDRMLLESYPYRIVEGMAIAAYSVGANQGYFYIRAEYPLAVQRVRHALEMCERADFLGDKIFGSHFSLNLKIMEGAGAFVCGEETALIKSIEGKRGMPRIRPPFPSQKGLWDAPTLVNNSETFSLVPWIMRMGAEKFARLGTGQSKGTKVFALAGKIARGGLIEARMGITIRQIVEEIGGGIANGKRFKAVQIGGPSGGCIPAEKADVSVDFESLNSVGAMMGSGGLVALDEDDCMVDIARYFLSFTQDQSCGKCTFCRIGTRRMLDILERFCEGRAQASDLSQLEKLAHLTKQGSLCGLGKTAPNPVLTTLKYFRHEYEAHIRGVCPAKKCKDLIAYSITDHCIGCTICAQQCPTEAIAFTPYQKHHIDANKCVCCDTCRQVCPRQAVIVQ